MKHLSEQFQNLSWHDQELTKSIVGAVNYRTVTEQKTKRMLIAVVGLVALALWIIFTVLLFQHLAQFGFWNYLALLTIPHIHTGLVLFALLESVPTGLLAGSLLSLTLVIWATRKALYHHYQFIRSSHH